MTTKEFIKKAKNAHGNKYDYSLAEYKNNHTKISIICKLHGVFQQIPSNHLKGCDCKKCGYLKVSKKKSLSVKQFIKKAKQVHKDNYDYSEAEYKNSHTKIKIICKKHGAFFQTPSNHITNKSNCPKCAIKKLAINDFIEQCNEVHNNKYNYSLTIFEKNNNIIKIICPNHGVFEKNIYDHLRGGGCQECSKERSNKIRTKKEFVKKANAVFESKYDYSLTNYTGHDNHVIIVCPYHGEYKKKPNSHLRGRGCPECMLENIKKQKTLTTKEFIKRAKLVHGQKYSYNETHYTTANEFVSIICKEHGVFRQKACSHLNGHGCKFCKKSKGELLIKTVLEKNKIKFYNEKIFDTCINPKTGRKLRFDFYLPDYNLLIEFDGRQHFDENVILHSSESLENIQYRDNIKNIWAQFNNIKLLRIPYTKINKINQILEMELTNGILG